MTPSPESIRSFLIAEVRNFLARVAGLPGIRRAAMIGSLTTPKPNPKDADLLVWVDDALDLQRLATAGRQLKGRAQTRNHGADVFLVGPNNQYLGRICRFRDCRPGIRVSCPALHCGRRRHLCDDLQVITLPPQVIQSPSVDLWPEVAIHANVPEDVRDMVMAIATGQGRAPVVRPQNA
jgi:hypothetical protein